ncbi:LacI family DNA-binding transcriptional regulator [Microbacterium sp. ZW T5_45]|uniref:LacI family DNA-binding transcriptional regulator n=1 Tax=Microbacterium sp. ZW T5_45 TaxID=3378080 RepID=UPI0038551374
MDVSAHSRRLRMTLQDRPATLADVALRAQVSVPTASRVLNGGIRGRESGDPTLRARVREAAEELGYAPSAAARTIKGGRSQSIAVIVNSIEDLGSTVMIGGIMHAAEDRDLAVAVRTTRDDSARELEVLRQLRGDRPRAVIVATSRTSDSAREERVGKELVLLRRQGARIVVIGDSALPFPKVTVDAANAAHELARGLAATGARRFAVVSGPEHEITAQTRLQGFLAGLHEAGVAVPQRFIAHAEFSRDGGVDAVHAFGTALQSVDVIAAMSDALAVGAIIGLRRLGLAVPRDVLVSGFDHIGVVSDLVPTLSTVRIPLAEMGQAAVAVAMNDGLADDHHEVLPHQVVLPCTPGEAS